jgi:phosphonate transport system ATP-binding protein
MTDLISPVVVLDQVSKLFAGRRALDRVSLTIEPGEFVAVIGRSGAGKTTFLRCLTRALSVSDGMIRFGDEDLGELNGRGLREHRARVGMIYQQFNLVKRLRVLDTVLIGRLPHPVARHAGRHSRGVPRVDRDRRPPPRARRTHRARAAADGHARREQQRVAIAKILAQEPRTILGDEPVASLDVANGAMVMETLRRVASSAGVTVVTTLHHVEYARRYADRVVGFRRGRMVFDGKAVELTDRAVTDIFDEGRPEDVDTALVPGREPRWAAS